MSSHDPYELKIDPPTPRKPESSEPDDTPGDVASPDAPPPVRQDASQAASFRYHDAFSRTLGLITHEEQAILRTRRVAIAGMGGVGGSHLLTLTRLGIGAFHISDFDRFDLVNFNRQAGASVSHLGQPKVEVMARLASDINPTLKIASFAQGVTPETIDDFLEGVDLYVDALDFFAVDARRMVFAACWERGIPAITAAPLGMSAALLNFIPGQRGAISFEQYFQLDDQPREEQYLRFLIGLAPRALHRTHIVDPSAIDLAAHRGPSTPMACQLCAGIVGTEALKILLQRGRAPAAPVGVQFDAMGNRLIRTWRPGGMRNPLQRLTLRLARRQMSQMLEQTRAQSQSVTGQPPLSNAMSQILHLARWSPSGDNTQPWRFEVVSDSHLIVHGRDTRHHCVYDLQGHASQIALGALLETIRIAATGSSMRAQVTRKLLSPQDKPVFDVHLTEDPTLETHPLLAAIPRRVTQRRAMSTRKLTDAQLAAMEQAAGPGYRIVWMAGLGKRWRVAKLLFSSAKVRLTIPEAFQVHKSIIEWHARYSEDRLPDKAVGLDPLALVFMRWAMKSWQRVDRLNRYCMGTWLPRIELDLIPAMRCGAHLAILSDKPPASIDDYLAAGAAMQRVWLTATNLGLQFQPQTTPGIFSEYARENIPFSQSPHAQPGAARVRRKLTALLGQEEVDKLVFLGRVGVGKRPTSRSTRLSVPKLRQFHHATSPLEQAPPEAPEAAMEIPGEASTEERPAASSSISTAHQDEAGQADAASSQEKAP